MQSRRYRYLRMCARCRGTGACDDLMPVVRCAICDGAGYVQRCRVCGDDAPPHRLCRDCEINVDVKGTRR